jgi:hypothetical protein
MALIGRFLARLLGIPTFAPWLMMLLSLARRCA